MRLKFDIVGGSLKKKKFKIKTTVKVKLEIFSFFYLSALE
jgi:hypothetical protein